MNIEIILVDNIIKLCKCGCGLEVTNNGNKYINRASTPGKAKQMGRNVPLRPDWDEVKDSIMEHYLHIKFLDPELRKLLNETKGKTLIEGNTWHDNYWGNCKCDKCKSIPGKNMLGKLLMKIRDEI